MSHGLIGAAVAERAPLPERQSSFAQLQFAYEQLRAIDWMESATVQEASDLIVMASQRLFDVQRQASVEGVDSLTEAQLAELSLIADLAHFILRLKVTVEVNEADQALYLQSKSGEVLTGANDLLHQAGAQKIKEADNR